jgi:hypothetical protein
MSNPINVNEFLADLTENLDFDLNLDQANDLQQQAALANPQLSEQASTQAGNQESALDQDTNTVTETVAGDGGNGGVALAGDGGNIAQGGLVNVNFGPAGDGGDANANGGDGGDAKSEVVVQPEQRNDQDFAQENDQDTDQESTQVSDQDADLEARADVIPEIDVDQEIEDAIEDFDVAI